MALQTALAVVSRRLVACRQAVRIMARDATQFPLARLIATALIHLFDLVDGFVVFVDFRLANENGLKEIERQTRPIIKRPPAAARDRFLTLQVALLADLVAQMGLQAARVDDGVIDFARVCAARSTSNMKFTGSMTALAADA